MRGSHVIKHRREGALKRLMASQFFAKNGRTEEKWQERKDKEIAILENHLGIRQSVKKNREEITLD